MLAEIFTLRLTLFIIFLAYPITFLQAQFFAAVLSPFSGLGSFFLTLALFSSVLAALTFNYAFGYMAVVGVIASDLAFGLPLFVFAPHVAVALAFAEGTASLKPFQVIANMTIKGDRENITSNLRLCFHRLRRKLLTIFVSLFALSTGYGLLPTIVPTSANVVGLAIYAAIGLLVFGIIVLYLGAGE